MIFWAPIKEEDAAQGFSGYTKATQLPIFTRPLNLPQVFLNGCLRPSSLTPDPKGVGSVADPEGMGPPYCLYVVRKGLRPKFHRSCVRKVAATDGARL